MIARIWRGWAPRETANDYQHHYETEVATHLTAIDGFQGARLLRRDDGEEVEFTSITFFTDMPAVHTFTGPNPTQAVVEEAAQATLSHWDKEVTHHEVATTL